jgi:hypothetical protein
MGQTNASAGADRLVIAAAATDGTEGAGNKRKEAAVRRALSGEVRHSRDRVLETLPDARNPFVPTGHFP